MESFNPTVNELFNAYCYARDLSMRLTPSTERMCWEATRDGITPEDMKIGIEARVRFNRMNNGCQKSLLLHKLIGFEQDRAIFINEIAEEKARQRKVVMPPARASVLKAVGRPTEPPETAAQSVANSELLNALKKAAG